MSDLNKAPWNVILAYTHLDYATGGNSSPPIDPHRALSLSSFLSHLPLDHPFLLHVPPSDRPHLIDVAAYLSGDHLAGVFSDVGQLDDRFLPHKILNRFARYVACNPSLSSYDLSSTGSELTCHVEHEYDKVLPEMPPAAVADDDLVPRSCLGDLELQFDNYIQLPYIQLPAYNPFLDASLKNLFVDDVNTNADILEMDWYTEIKKDEQLDDRLEGNKRANNKASRLISKRNQQQKEQSTKEDHPLWLPVLLRGNDVLAPFSFTTHGNNQTRKRRNYKRPRNELADDSLPSLSRAFAAFDPISKPVYLLSQQEVSVGSSSSDFTFAYDYASSSPLYTPQFMHKIYNSSTASDNRPIPYNDQYSTRNKNTNFITTTPGAGFVSLSMPSTLDQKMKANTNQKEGIEEIEEDNVQARKGIRGGDGTDVGETGLQ